MKTRFAGVIAAAVSLVFVAPIAANANQTVTGEGNATVALTGITKSVIVEISMTAEGPVEAKPVLRNGGRTFPWVDTMGPWSGTVFQEKEIKPIVGAKVTSAGPWTITVKPLASAPRVTSGSTSMVIQLKKATRGVVTKKFTHQGQGDFKVFPISGKGMSGFALVEETGPYSGRAVLPPGTRYIAITASGNWRMS
jgi:hypothetical protein